MLLQLLLVAPLRQRRPVCPHSVISLRTTGHTLGCRLERDAQRRMNDFPLTHLVAGQQLVVVRVEHRCDTILRLLECRTFLRQVHCVGLIFGVLLDELPVVHIHGPEQRRGLLLQSVRHAVRRRTLDAAKQRSCSQAACLAMRRLACKLLHRPKPFQRSFHLVQVGLRLLAVRARPRVHHPFRHSRTQRLLVRLGLRHAPRRCHGHPTDAAKACNLDRRAIGLPEAVVEQRVQLRGLLWELHHGLAPLVLLGRGNEALDVGTIRIQLALCRVQVHLDRLHVRGLGLGLVRRRQELRRLRLEPMSLGAQRLRGQEHRLRPRRRPHRCHHRHRHTKTHHARSPHCSGQPTCSPLHFSLHPSLPLHK